MRIKTVIGEESCRVVKIRTSRYSVIYNTPFLKAPRRKSHDANRPNLTHAQRLFARSFSLILREESRYIIHEPNVSLARFRFLSFKNKLPLGKNSKFFRPHMRLGRLSSVILLRHTTPTVTSSVAHRLFRPHAKFRGIYTTGWVRVSH